MTQKKKTPKNKKVVEKVEAKSEKVWEFKCYSGLLKKMLKKISPISEEFPIDITKKGINVRCVDPSHVLMVDLNIPSKDFVTGTTAINKSCDYKVKEEIRVGLDAERLENKFLKLINQYDTVSGYIQDNCLFLNTDEVHTKISLLDAIGMPEPKLPELKLDVKGKVGGHAIGLMVKAKESSDCITLVADKKLECIIEDDEDDVKIDLTNDVKGKGRSIYSTDYLGKVLSTNNNRCEFEFSTDNPIRITGKLGDNGRYMYLLAPRIEGE